MADNMASKLAALEKVAFSEAPIASTTKHWKPSKAGDEFVGLLLGQGEDGERITFKFLVRDGEDAVERSILSTHSLKRQCKQLPANSPVRVVSIDGATEYNVFTPKKK